MTQTEIAHSIIAEFYGQSRAKRSNELLIKHIDDGLRVLDQLGASDTTKAAYALHPIFQTDDQLPKVRFIREIEQLTHWTIVLACEYRNIANAYLSTRRITNINQITLSPLYEVNQMLMADKVQNFHDFMMHHYGKHERSEALFNYFNNWFERLGIEPEDFKGCFTE